MPGALAIKSGTADANGRDAVWAGYEACFILGEPGGDDRTGGAMASGSPGNRVTLAFRDNSGTTNDGLGVWDNGRMVMY